MKNSWFYVSYYFSLLRKLKEILLKAPGKSIKKLEMKKFMAMIGQKFEVFTIFLRKI